MNSYLNYLVCRNNGNFKKAMNELISTNNTVSVPIGTKKHKHYINIGNNIQLDKRIIEKYSVEYYLAHNDNVNPSIRLCEFDYIDGPNNIIMYEYGKDNSRCSKFSLFAHLLVNGLESGQYKMSIDGLSALVYYNILKQ